MINQLFPPVALIVDVDGVLVNSKSLARQSGLYAPADPDCVRRLNRIIHVYNPVLVVCSTWRLQGLDFIKAKFKEWSVAKEVFDITPRLESDAKGLTRTDEIHDWLDNHYQPRPAWLVLDDEKLDVPINHQVHTRFEVGITESDVTKALWKLGRQVLK